MEKARIDGGRFRTAFVLVLVLGISLLFLAVIWPFLQTLLMAALLSGLVHPLYRVIVSLFRGRRGLASVFTIVILFLLVIGPVSAMLGLVVQQALGVSEHAIPWLQKNLGGASNFDAHDWLVERFPIGADFVPSQEEIVNTAGTVAKAAGTYLVATASTFTAGTAGFLLNFFVMVYAMYFFLKDGREILERIFYYMPLSHEDEVRMLDRFTSVTRATIKGTLLIGLIQGTLAGLAFHFAGIDGAAFWGTVMVILSVIPGIGSALVWIPAVIYLFVSKQPVHASLLGVWCAVVVSTVDNVLRPTLVGKDAELPDLLIMIGTLGGLFLFGPVGFIIGPIICGLFLTALDIYGTAFSHILPPVRGLQRAEKTKPAPNVPVDDEPSAPAKKKKNDAHE